MTQAMQVNLMQQALMEEKGSPDFSSYHFQVVLSNGILCGKVVAFFLL
jgi:hypothetical protein